MNPAVHRLADTASQIPFSTLLPASPLVLITGGAGGLGREIALQFMARGARVHVCDIDAKRLAEFAEQHDASQLRTSCADIGDARAAERLFEDVAAWGDPVSVLVNNVGIAGARAPVDELTDEAWLESLQANFLGATRCVRHVASGMKQARAGVIVNISTVSVRTLPPSRAPYIVSKAALESLSMTLARELGSFGVRANIIRPGGMDNDRLRQVLARVAAEEGLDVDVLLAREMKHVWMRTLVSMHDVASMVLYLASDAAKHVTGQVIEVDGGVDWEG
ncbi:SDR family oxidoreductase [Steroidobacter sp.]|uniref:SDR family oxidoreductase n=1 Tax=Steroidobacter sp. TaxID=1978227 RepID=UPI001A42D098|nr:SDR family oxidoreductase [Steroidobacter sp.]MBL8271904.1 SDR family oxidoreductase [Steroidobacter sp.]